MRQVPQNSYLIVGDGKLARHWALFLKLNNLPFHQWSRSKSDDVELLSHLSKTKAVFVAINDDSLGQFYDKHLSDYKGEAYHFSGSYYRPGFIGLHPLMTFPEALYPEHIYEDLSFTVDHPRPLDFLDAIENQCLAILPDHKPLYHALCVVTANFPQMLWQFSLAEFENLGIPKEALYPLMTQSLQNFLQSPETALTGPHSRRDFTTINANSRALEHKPHKAIYDAFTSVYGKTLEETANVHS